MKTCSRCKVEKTIDSFGPYKAAKDGLHVWCRPCSNAYHKEYKERNVEKVNEWRRKTHLKGRYGIDQAQFDKMLSDQNNSCAICFTRVTESSRTVNFYIDHDHACCPGHKSCGKCIRGLLCNSCNTTLGFVKDSVETLEAMISYLRRGVK